MSSLAQSTQHKHRRARGTRAQNYFPFPFASRRRRLALENDDAPPHHRASRATRICCFGMYMDAPHRRTIIIMQSLGACNNNVEQTVRCTNMCEHCQYAGRSFSKCVSTVHTHNSVLRIVLLHSVVEHGCSAEIVCVCMCVGRVERKMLSMPKHARTFCVYTKYVGTLGWEAHMCVIECVR